MLLRTVEKLYGDVAFRGKIEHQACLVAERKYDEEVYVKRYADLYRTIMNNGWKDKFRSHA